MTMKETWKFVPYNVSEIPTRKKKRRVSKETWKMLKTQVEVKKKKEKDNKIKAKQEK